MIMSLQRSLAREKTQNKTGAQRMLDLELASVTSKEYDPENIPIYSTVNNGFKSSAQQLAASTKLASSVAMRRVSNANKDGQRATNNNAHSSSSVRQKDE